MIIQGDALEILKTLQSGSVNCIVTSPPYYGLRDFVGIKLNPFYISLAEMRVSKWA